MNEQAAVLLSGGLDSTALCAWKRPRVAITINYGQVCAAAEIVAARQICAELDISLHELSLNCRELGSGDLAGHPASAFAPASDWWPYRNQLLVTTAAMRAIAIDVDHLMIGTVASDSNHTDGTVQFIDAMDRVLAMQEGALRLSAPAITLTSVELIQRSSINISTLCWAHSCHTNNLACGRCRGCNKHRQVMAGLGYEPF